jgi:hypothetical protein
LVFALEIELIPVISSQPSECPTPVVVAGILLLTYLWRRAGLDLSPVQTGLPIDAREPRSVAGIEFRDGIVGSPNAKRNVMRLVRPALDRAVKLEHISKNRFDSIGNQTSRSAASRALSRSKQRTCKSC